MSSERHRRAKEVFLAACDLEDDGRSTFLDEACGDDHGLRREVEALLEFDWAGEQPRLAAAPVRVGHFRLLQKIGEGGMGEVWEAEQEAPVRRRVAFKVIKWGMDTREVLARFESERQALALMNHLNIAKAFEAGSTDEGRPFFSMEFVKGVPITEYCDVQRLDTRDRLALFMQVCEGVQHAHQKGVIHRDIKPSNILVAVEDGRPVPKIIDFGVAKATSQRLTERTLFTELGQWIGTPEYMSPEQAELTGLDVDTRSDVYSLGVVLYELLAGIQPFDATELRTAGFDEMRRRIREEEPPRPSTRVSSLGDASQLAAERRRTDITGLTRTLRGDLDWIVMKSLEKDRTRRYGSPTELAADVRRYLQSEPVEAGPPGAIYRARKFVNRHRVGVAASAALVVLLAAGVVGTGAGLLRAQREAEASRRSADVLEGVLGALDPSQPLGRASTSLELLDSGTDRVVSELADMPRVQARLLNTLGRAYLNLGHFEEALPLLMRSHAIRQREFGRDHPVVAATLSDLGWVQYWLADFSASRESFEQSLRIRERSPESTEAEIARSLASLAFLEWRSGRYRISDELFEGAVGLIEHSEESDGLTMADVLYQRGLLWVNLGRYDEAREIASRTLKIRRFILGEDHSDVGWAYHLMAVCSMALGDPETGVRYARISLGIFEEQLGPDHWAVAFPMTILANFHRREGRRDEARILYQRGLDIRRANLPADHPDQCYSLVPFGVFLLDGGEIDEAEELFREAVRITEKTLGPEHSETAGARAHLSLVSWRRGEYEKALIGMAQAMENHRTTLPPDHPVIAVNHFLQATCQAQLGQTEAALEHLREVRSSHRLTAEMVEHEMLAPLHGNSDFEELADQTRADH